MRTTLFPTFGLILSIMRQKSRLRPPVYNQLLCLQNTLCSETIEAMSKKAHARRINQLACSFLERFPRSHTPAEASALPPENTHVDVASLLPRPLRRVVFKTASSSLKLASGVLHV